MKNDFEIKLLMLKMHLKEAKDIKYSEKCDNNLIYIFNNYTEYRNYFLKNGFNNFDIDFDMIESCKIKTTKTGKVIAYKHLCDKQIKKYNSIRSNIPKKLVLLKSK